MITTENQFNKFIDKNPEGSIFIYPQKRGVFMLILFETGVIDYIKPELIKVLTTKGIIFPFVCHTVDRNKIKQKEGGNS